MMSSIKSPEMYAFNPRGNLWLNDKQKFGLKILKKMGWSSGKGLGRNEDGIKEIIKLKRKNSKSGVGWKELPIGIQSDNYDILLSSLCESYLPKENSENNVENHKDIGLEQRSQQFKKRLHYRKLVTVKDISRYSEKDMQSIFISKQTAEDSGKNSDLNDSQDKFSKSYLSMDEYFAKKLKKPCEKEEQKDHVTEAENNYDNEDDLKLALNKHSNDELLMEPEPDYIEKVSRKKRKTPEELQKKSKKIKTIAEAENNYDNEDDLKLALNKHSNDELLMEPEPDYVEKVSRKKRKKSEELQKKSKKIKTKVENNYDNEDDLKQSLNKHSNDELLMEPEPDYIEKVSRKERKKSMLKSCLKEKHNSEKTTLKRQVSFSEEFSFKTFNNELEATTMSDEKISSILSEEKMELYCSESNENIDLNDQILESDQLFEKNKDTDPKLNVGMIESNDDKNMTLNIHTAKSRNMGFNSRNVKKLALLPDPVKRPSVYNSWIENQRQALRMKLYKDMLNKIQEHAILKSSNLSKIKGYGNWGF